jgi:SAM-dependent methyltransferase
MAVPGAANLSGACVLCGGTTRRPMFRKQGWTFVRCGTCGLVSLSPLPTAEELRQHHAATCDIGLYDVFTARVDIRDAIARQRFQAVAAAAPPGPWLEVGCSTGQFLAQARAAGVTAEGIDLSSSALARARAQGLVVHEAAVEEFVPRAPYAAVMAFDVVEHLADPLAFVRRVVSWLVPGGLFAMTVPNAASFTARAMGRHWFQYWAPDHVHYFSPATARRMAVACGLGDVQTRPAGKPLTLEYAVDRLRASNPLQGRVAGLAAACVPAAWRSRSWAMPLGEMLVTARRAG